MGKTWSRGTNSRLPFDVNVNLNLSIVVATIIDFMTVEDWGE